MVLATHEHREAEILCDQVAVVERGRISARGSVAEILSSRGGRHLRHPGGAEAAS